MKMNKMAVFAVVVLLLLTGCGSNKGQVMDGDGMFQIQQYTQITQEDTMTESYGDMSPTAILTVSVGESFFSVDLENNSSAEEFLEKIKEENLKIVMHDYGGFEKVGELPWSITRNDEDITTEPGDVILYQANQITVYYDENTWSFTKLGHLNGTEDEILEAFGGKEDVTAEFFVEWTE